MGANKENIEFTDPETGEVFPLDATSLVSNVRDVLLSRRRLQTEATVWSKMKEAAQKDEITAMQELARWLVEAVVHRVAEKGLTCANVEVSKFAVDVEKGVVTITSSGYASDEMLSDLAHAKGKTAMLTIVDARQFDEKSTMVQPTPDQLSLLPDDAEPAAEMSEAEVEQIAAEMDEQLGDGDDLNSKEWIEGYEARMAGYHSQRSPYDIDSKEREQWYLGWDAADKSGDAPEVDESLGLEEKTAPADEGEVGDGESEAEVRGAGYDARTQGLAPTRCPWKKGSPEHKLWMEGYSKAKEEEAA